MDGGRSTEPSVLRFKIGPKSVGGRAIAFRVLTSVYWRHLVAIFRSEAVNTLTGWRLVAALLVRELRAWMNPRSPNFILLSVIATTLFFRNLRLRVQHKAMKFSRNFWASQMKSAMTYAEWYEAATAMERATPRAKRDADMYDEELVRHRLRQLRDHRKHGGIASIMFNLRTDLVRNLGGMCNPALHQGRVQMPRVIQDYIDEAKVHLRMVVEAEQDNLPLEERLAFVHEVRHAFGRTALLLSGGAALGAFHLGVMRTLVEHNLLPRVLSGASVGSIICSFAATRNWPELIRFFDEAMPSMNFFDTMGSIFASAHRLMTRGALHEIDQLQRKMRELIGDLTFQEAYEISGRVLGISVCSPRKYEPPRLLNYLSSPHVVIWSAVSASCAFPGLFEAQELMAKDRKGRIVPYFDAKMGNSDEPGLSRQWRDGSLESDLPMTQLKELFNVNHFIVSQANPHIAPFLRLKGALRYYVGDFAGKLAHVAEMEVKHRCNQLLQLGIQLGGVAKLFAQEWEGDITIVMPATLAQFAKLIQNPTPNELRKAVLQGKRCTWAKLPAIYANCGIEQTLDECVSELNRSRKLYREQHLKEKKLQKLKGEEEPIRVQGGAFSGGGRRIPSWNCLQRECSWGSMDDGGEGPSRSLQHGVWAKKGLRGRQQESDSESEPVQPQLSWTVGGGPMGRSSSAMELTSLATIGEPLPPGPEAEASGETSAANSPRDDTVDGSCSGDDAESPVGKDCVSASRFRVVRRGRFTWGKKPGPVAQQQSSLSDDGGSGMEESDAKDRFLGLALWNGVVSPRSPGSLTTLASLPEVTSYVDSPVAVTRSDGGKRLRRTLVSEEDFRSAGVLPLEGDEKENDQTASGPAGLNEVFVELPEEESEESQSCLEDHDEGELKELLVNRMLVNYGTETGAFGSFVLRESSCH